MQTIQIFIIGVLAGFLFGLCTCKSCTKPCSTTIDTVIQKKTDTVHITLPAQSAEIPQPTMASETKPKTDSFIQFLDADTNAILKPLTEKYNMLADKYNKLFLDHNTARSYEDSAHFDNGTVIGTGQVSQNKLRAWKFTLRDVPQTIITNTITHTIEQKRTIGFFGLQGGYGIRDSSIYIGAAFRLKFRNDALLGMSAKYSSRSNLLMEGEYAVPIRLSKRK